ncbi:HAD family hydrolase [Sneathia vaginalis]|uniref:HAD family hydrolase n=1 Tax=Sneathia vaginalis TaxID=187101 RepID=UPI00370D1B14
MKNIATFFDVDGTIFRNSLLIEHFKLLIKNGYLSKDAWTSSVEKNFENWSNREGDYDTYLEDLVNKYVEGIKNISEEVVNKIAEEVIEKKSDKLYRYAKECIEVHRQKGHKLILISGSPDFLVEKMAKKLGFDDYKATIYVINNGSYTGEQIPMWDSYSKNKAINEYVTKYGLNLNDCYSYGDTTGDVSMLRLVGHPYAINPAKRLLDTICEDEDLSNKVTLIIERKDVIYKLNPKTIEYNR